MLVSNENAALAAEEEGAVVEILDRFDEPALFGGTEVERDGEKEIEGGQPVTVTVHGMNSKRYAKAEAWQRKQLQLLGGRQPTDKQQLEMWCGFLARCCSAWAGFFGASEHEPIAFTTENVTDVLIKLPFIRRQIASAVGRPTVGSRQKTETV